MASTFVGYRGRCAQVPESALICIGYIMFHEGLLNAKSQEAKGRIEQMACDFEHRTVGVGCTDLGLDTMLQGSRENEAEFLSFVRYARERLLHFGENLPAEYVDEVIAVHEPDYKGRSLGSPWFGKVLNVIEALIRGEPIQREWCL